MGRTPKFTKEELVAALERAGGDPNDAAADLGVDPSTVYRAQARLGVEVIQERRVVTTKDAA